MEVNLPTNLKVLTIDRYDGSINLDEHLHMYVT